MLFRSDKAKETLIKSGDLVELAPLVPFKPLMVRMLKARGENVTLTTKMDKIVPLFYERIVKKSTKINYQELENVDTETANAIMSMVSPILDFIKEIIHKKDRGAKLNEDEDEVYQGAKEVQQKVEQQAVTDDTNWLKQYGVIIIGAAAVILFLAFRKK